MNEPEPDNPAGYRIMPYSNSIQHTVYGENLRGCIIRHTVYGENFWAELFGIRYILRNRIIRFWLDSLVFRIIQELRDL